MMGKLDSGQRLFTITSSELVEKYLDMQQHRVDGGFITQQRRSTIITQLYDFMDLQCFPSCSRFPIIFHACSYFS